MAANLDDGEFWLPPQFLDDEVVMEESKSDGFGGLDADALKGLFPFEFPCGFGSCGVASDVSSPVESVVGSSETESDEEEHMAELSRQMAHSTLGVDFENACATEKSKGMFSSGSPQSTLCAVGSGCGCRKGSNHSSPNSVCQFSSQKATWDLLNAAAGEVERMRLNGGYGFNHQRGLLGPPTNNSLLTPPAKNANPDVGFHTQQSLSHQQLQAAQFQLLRQQQEMAKQQGSVWGMQPKATVPYQLRQSNHQMVPNRVRNSEISGSRSNRVVGLSPSAWPPLQQAKQQQLQNQQFGSGMRAVFLANPTAKRECAGTGVFLPRRVDSPAPPRKKSACSTVLVPARVVHALNLKLENIEGRQLLYQPPRFSGSSNIENDAGAHRLRSNYAVVHPKKNLRPQPAAANHEIRLPQEWTY
ncbi:hypothetical protein L6164_000562 [Bauhinia variegata]|uniref:Uncharacterized protein n=1 Tax=Bauhinia variegata TaxID=167791 RepID=A0ACB9Q6F1_BAUVA|nr:hypothetical protein L6164_000562 [Bauhinia variegata]